MPENREGLQESTLAAMALGAMLTPGVAGLAQEVADLRVEVARLRVLHEGLKAERDELRRLLANATDPENAGDWDEARALAAEVTWNNGTGIPTCMNHPSRLAVEMDQDGLGFCEECRAVPPPTRDEQRSVDEYISDPEGER